uniref:Uncharacterized protein n=1 Tax=Panagrolaimus superbus TaxID=310955 RepID=A0A914Y8B4_9BILA
MAGMSLPASASAPASANPACVINCVHYDDEGKRHDISLDAISDVIASGNGRILPARPGHRGRAQRAPAAQGRDLRQLAVRGGDHRTDGRRTHPVRRNPRLPRSALPGDGAPRCLTVLRPGACTGGTRAAAAEDGPVVLPVRGDRLRGRQLPADRASLPRHPGPAGKGHLRRQLQAQHGGAAVRAQARTEQDADGGGAATGCAGTAAPLPGRADSR